MSYEILLTDEAVRDLRKLDSDIEKRIIKNTTQYEPIHWNQRSR